MVKRLGRTVNPLHARKRRKPRPSAWEDRGSDRTQVRDPYPTRRAGPQRETRRVGVAYATTFIGMD
ncbi:hypothetical protein GCM10009560_62140 [Nonomuraea longicatena]|uniref:Uncharacterized protein n=1 Tax=Nonomuraea longicatena TaxID=83682 RepID=A0ABP4B9N3_9ACTN